MSGFRRLIKQKLRIRNTLVRQGLAEFIGTFILVALGDGSVAQSVLSRGANGEFLSINLAWGWAVAMGVWLAGGVSGGHLNPAVSLLTAILGRISFAQMFVYMIAQYLGAFVGAASVYGTYVDALNNYDGGIRTVIGANKTAGIFATYPEEYVSIAQGFWDQVFGTLILTLTIFAITDSNNMKTSPGAVPICVGGVVTVIGMSYGLNCGYAINPARDFSPRLFTLAAGWGTEVFSACNYWFWVPLVAPHIGAILGGLIYLGLIGIHLEEEEPESIDTKEMRQIGDRF